MITYRDRGIKPFGMVCAPTPKLSAYGIEGYLQRRIHRPWRKRGS